MKRTLTLSLAIGLSAVVASPVVAQQAPAAQADTFTSPQPVDISGLQLEPGLSLRAFDVGEDMSRLPNLVAGQTGNINRLVKEINLSNDDFGPLEDRFYAELRGYLLIEEPGEYEFSLASDDGSEFRLSDQLIIGHDGLHGSDIPREDYLTLQPGAYPILLRMFDQYVDATLILKWRKPGSSEYEVIGSDVLRAQADQVRVTSPGQKQIEIPDGPIESRRRPGDRQPLASVHPAFDLVDLRPEGFEPKVGGIDFLPDGRMILCLWEPEGRVMILDHVVGDDVDASKVEIKEFAAGLAEPLGIKVMTGEDGKPRIYVLQKQELTELIDRDGDDVADEYRVAVTGWPVSDNFHEFAFGLAEKDGLLYANLAVAINPGGKTTEVQVPGRGTAIELDPIKGTYRTVAAGLRTPNGVGVGVDGEIFLTDNQGDWMPSSKVLHLQEGAFYNGYINPPHPLSINNEVTPPVVWLPHGEIGNSPTNIVPVPESWGPYTGQMLHADVTHGGVKRVYAEKINGQYQGVVFRFTQGLESGTNRIDIGPDGDLYAGGIGSTGDWQQAGTKWYGLQKLAWNGDVPFEMLAVRPGKFGDDHGIEIEFTQPLAQGSGETPQSYRLRQWTYEPTSTYGGPKIDKQAVDVESVTLSSDRRRAYLNVSDRTPLQDGYVIYLTLRDGGEHAVRGAGDVRAWSTEAWYTLNQLPERRPDFAADTSNHEQNMNAQAAATEDGFTPLFDGTAESLEANWRGFKKEGVPDEWQTQDGTLALTRGGAGDLITKEKYQDFDLRFDWNISERGNSGVIYRVAEEGPNTGATFETGFELQLLDDTGYPEWPRDHLSGALYDVYTVPESVPATKAGEWNTSRIVVKDGKIEHYLNGKLVAETQLGSDDWKQHLANSKFADWPRFGKVERGHIALQDHGNPVRFRNIRIKPLD